jgi:Holliday junction resolvase RusA-like endonuclease
MELDPLQNLSDPQVLRVDIAPRPACRPRFRSNGCVYNDPKYKEWLDDFSQIVMREWLKEPLTHVSHLSIVFNGETKRGDLDNYLKATLDGLVYAGVLKNDNLGVLDSIETSFIRTLNSPPWIIIKIHP